MTTAKRKAPVTSRGKAGGKKSAAKKASAEQKYTDPDLRERLKDEIMASDKGGKPGQWSARKAQLLAAEYKREGGDYKGEKSASARHLDQWTKEKWQTRDGDTRARQGKTTKRYLPKAAWDKLSPEEREKTDAKKRTASRKGKQFVANTPKARKVGATARGEMV